MIILLEKACYLVTGRIMGRYGGEWGIRGKDTFRGQLPASR